MRNLRKPRISLLMRGVPAALAALALSSCSSVTGSLDGVTGFEKVSGISEGAAPDAAYTLEILHVNDVHSNIDPVRISLRTGDGEDAPRRSRRT